MGLAHLVVMMSAEDFFFWSSITGVLAIGGFAAGFRYLHHQRLIENVPTSRLRSAAQGYLELEGTARLMAGDLIVSPLTATRCIWWRYKVERKQRSGKRTEWVHVQGGLSDDSFLLDDGTGTCVVDPVGASVIPALRRRWYGHRPHPDVAPAHGQGFWRSIGCDYRYTEELIFEETVVYALGAFRTQTGQDHFDEQADLRELLNKWKHDRRMMAVLDVNKDGTVDQKEWEAARRMGAGQVRQQHVERAVNTPDLHILAKPRDARPYILSGIAQADLIGHYRRMALGSFAAMAVAGPVFLWLLQSRGLL